MRKNVSIKISGKLIKYGLLFIILAVVVGGVVYVSNMLNTSQQTTNTRADTNTDVNPQGATDPCGFITVTNKENPVCPRLAKAIDEQGNPVTPVTQTNNVSEYSTTYSFKNISNQNRTITYKKLSFFCEKPYGDANKGFAAPGGGYSAMCIDNKKEEDVTITLQPGEVHDVTITVQNTSASKCGGTFQTDTAFGTFQTDVVLQSVDGNNQCSLPPKGQEAAWGYVAGWGLCQTGKTFSACAPTGAPTAAPTTAPGESPVPTAVPTGAPTTAPSGTPAPTVTQGPTPTTYAPQGCGLLSFSAKVCKEPEAVSCGDECGQGIGSCDSNHVCTKGSDGKSYCALRSQQTSCGEETSFANCCSVPTATPYPTQPAPPTNVPQPTYTPLPPQQVIVQVPVQQVQPTYTPLPPPPTYTLIPTFTPYPSQAPQATYTPVPPPPVSGNPIPWIVAGIPVLLIIAGMFL